jgi:hypothetical protein
VRQLGRHNRHVRTRHEIAETRVKIGYKSSGREQGERP